MAKRSIVWTKTADIQFVGVLDYWSKRNQSNWYSKKLIRLVSERMKLLSDKPFISKATDFGDIRVSSMGKFNIFYKITDDKIIIYAFWDTRQDPKKLLEYLQK